MSTLGDRVRMVEGRRMGSVGIVAKDIYGGGGMTGKETGEHID